MVGSSSGDTYLYSIHGAAGVLAIGGFSDDPSLVSSTYGDFYALLESNASYRFFKQISSQLRNMVVKLSPLASKMVAVINDSILGLSTYLFIDIATGDIYK